MRRVREWWQGCTRAARTREPLVPDGPGAWLEVEPLVRAIAWREAWGCWVTTRGTEERIVDIHSRNAQDWTPHFLASAAGDEWHERPEPWIELAVAAVAAGKEKA